MEEQSHEQAQDTYFTRLRPAGPGGIAERGRAPAAAAATGGGQPLSCAAGRHLGDSAAAPLEALRVPGPAAALAYSRQDASVVLDHSHVHASYARDAPAYNVQ